MCLKLQMMNCAFVHTGPFSRQCQFYNEKDGFVISGDALFAGSIGRTDLPGGDFEQLEHAIKTQLYTLPDAVKVYPDHRRYEYWV